MPFATERERVAHLLRRSGFGLSQPDLDAYAPLGVEGAVDKLLAAAYRPADSELDVWLLTDAKKGRLAAPAVASVDWWLLISIALTGRHKMPAVVDDALERLGRAIHAAVLLEEGGRSGVVH